MKPHANSHQNQAPHHLYEIRDRERGGVYKYGICGELLLPDGSSRRANRQVREFNRLVGSARFYAQILLFDIPGRLRAEEMEEEKILEYQQLHGERPPGNPPRSRQFD